MSIRTIETDELRRKLAASDDFRLVMTLGERAFAQAHIPGSEHFASVDDALAVLGPDEQIVVYCTDRTCVASQFAYRALVSAGYTNVRRYAGGLAEWDAAGLELVASEPD